MNDLIIKDNNLTVKNNTLKVVEYKGKRVISSYDIARLHDKEVKAVNQQFERNKDRLQEDIDYFLVDKEEFAVTDCDHKISSKSRHKFERLFTERGYMKLVKSFTDDLSWEIQDLLVDSYFKLKEISTKQSLLLGILEASDELSRAIAINQYEVGYVKPLELKVEQQEEKIKELKPKGEFYDAVAQSNSTLSLEQVAKLLNFKNMGRNNLCKYLRDKNIFNHKNVPYQKYIDAGYFKLTESSWRNPYTEELQVSIKTVVYQKGVDWLDRKLKAEGYQRNERPQDLL